MGRGTRAVAAHRRGEPRRTIAARAITARCDVRHYLAL